MTTDLLLMADLELVEAEGVFDFTEGDFDTPAEQVSDDDILGRHIDFVRDEDVKIFIVFVRPFVKNEDDFDGSGTVFEFRLKGVGKKVFMVAVFVINAD